MATKKVNEVVGYVQCLNEGCAHIADVRQSKKAGRYFYMSCPGCGMNQQTKTRPQNYIWHRAEWVPGAQVLKPSNIENDWVFDESEDPPEKIRVPEPVLEQKSDIAPDFCPINEAEAEPKTQAHDKSGPGGLVGGVLLLLAAVGAIWSMI